MNEKFLVLEQIIREDLGVIGEIYASLPPAPLSDEVTEETLIVIAYRLHRLYSAVENIFSNIAAAFENHLDDKAGWHRQLLVRMGLDLRPLRPAVISPETRDRLDDLRRFRHLFRSAYHLRLDFQRLSLVLAEVWEMRDPLEREIEEFLHFLHTAEPPAPAPAPQPKNR